MEIPDELRARLHAVAARRGWRGYSRVIKDAVEAYLRQQQLEEVARRSLLARQGSWDARAARVARQAVKEVRARWER